jgi:hypothetical protein
VRHVIRITKRSRHLILRIDAVSEGALEIAFTCAGRLERDEPVVSEPKESVKYAAVVAVSTPYGSVRVDGVGRRTIFWLAPGASTIVKVPFGARRKACKTPFASMEKPTISP